MRQVASLLPVFAAVQLLTSGNGMEYNPCNEHQFLTQLHALVMGGIVHVPPFHSVTEELVI